jgi:beta-glucosidase
MGQMGGNYNYDAVIDTQWPFGSGISYTTYKYSNLKCDRTTFAAGDELTFTVDVTNTGKVAGKEAVLLFSSDLIASISPDKRRLRYFDKVELQPGETKTVTMKIKANDLAFVGYDNHWRLEKGDFIMTCGDRELAISCMNDRIWETQNIE